jgi:beta-N-acetylhexosaminidase
MKRMARTYILIGVLAVIAAVMGVLYVTRPEPTTLPVSELVPTPTPTVLLPEQPPELKTPAEKIAQLFAAPLDMSATNASVSAQLQWIDAEHPGFVTLFGSAIASDEAYMTTASLDQNYAGYPVGVSVAVDHEGGTVQRLSGDGFTTLPSWQQLCKLQSAARMDIFGRSALELSEAGIDVVFAPVIDLATGSGVLRSRACDDARLLKAAASEFIQSMRAVGIEPVIKHFPGIGSAQFDTHKQFATITPILAESELFSDLLDQFEKLSVMTAHVGVSTLDPELPCSLQKECIAALSENYPDSLVFSDALEMVAAAHRAAPQPPKPLAQVAREAIVAGNDVLVFGPTVSASELAGIHRFLVQEYQDSPAFQVAVEQRVAKVLAYKQRAGFATAARAE